MTKELENEFVASEFERVKHVGKLVGFDNEHLLALMMVTLRLLRVELVGDDPAVLERCMDRADRYFQERLSADHGPNCTCGQVAPMDVQ